MSTSRDWAPSVYLKFEGERTRAARDLLVGASLEIAERIVDVGCGPGNSTELLASRYPQANILGIDNSPAMLAAASQRLPRLRFETADANTWIPAPDVDMVFANATYQWVPDHLRQLPRVLAALRPGAVLAVQMPDNVAEPTHRLMKEVAEAGPWAARLAGAPRAQLPSAVSYYESFKPAAARIDIWRTTYHHVLPDAAAIVEFVSATGLRPFLDPLSETERAEYLAAYKAKIAAAYPPMSDGKVMLAFPRLFIVARR
jgi:trans-aconitate 2-methyltransferase